jgi:iron(III) transport system substrate-binding protein
MSQPAPARRPGLRWLATAAAALAASGLVAACGSASGNSGPGTTLTLYSGQHIQTADSLVAAFEQQTGIHVQIRSDDEDALADQIETEGSGSPADLLYTENTPPLMSLQSKGLLARVDASTLSHTPAKDNSPAGDWVGVSARTSVIVWNPALIKASQLPTQISQFASPKYKGLLAIAPQETDFQPIVTAYRRAYGTAATLTWLRGIKANAAGHVYPDNETIASEVNQGAVAFGLVNQYYWYRMQAEIGTSRVKAQITHLAPGNPGYVVDVSGAAVLKSSTHQAAAQRFLAFLVSHTGQETIAHSHSYEYPLRPGVAPAPGLRPFADLKPSPLTPAELGDGSQALALEQKLGLL